MNRCTSLVALALLSLAAGPAEEASKKDLAAMQGEWLLEKQTRNGEVVAAENLKRVVRVTKGAAFTATIDAPEGKQTIHADFKLNASRSPKEMDVTFKDGPLEGQTMLTIYEIDGDTLRICHDRHGAVRPKKFECEEGTGLTLSVWKQKKSNGK